MVCFYCYNNDNNVVYGGVSNHDDDGYDAATNSDVDDDDDDSSNDEDVDRTYLIPVIHSTNLTIQISKQLKCSNLLKCKKYT